MTPAAACGATCAKPLVRRAQEGDGEAFSALFAAYWPEAVAVAQRVVRDPVLAEDVAQEAFIKIYRHLGGFAFRAPFQSWLYRVVVNHALTTLRRQARRAAAVGEGVIPPAVLSPEDQVAQDELRRRVRGALTRLDPDLRRLLLWKYFHGLTEGEIARRLGWPLGTVKSRLHRTRRQLEAALAQEWQG